MLKGGDKIYKFSVKLGFSVLLYHYYSCCCCNCKVLAIPRPIGNEADIPRIMSLIKQCSI